MTHADYLFTLIKSLSKNEKRHFKLLSGMQSGEKNYLKLFDAFDKQKVYDEKVILRQYAKEKFVKNFSVAKDYLYENILNSLEIFHNNKDIDRQLRKLINHIQILSARKLFDQSLKLLSKAKKLASEYELHTYAYELCIMEESIFQNKLDRKWLQENNKQVYKKQDDILKLVKNVQAYRQLNAKFILWTITHGNVRTPETFEELDKLKKSDLLKNPAHAKTGKGIGLYYFLNGYYYAFTNNKRKSLDYFIRLKNLFTQTPVLKKDRVMYRTTLNNIISVGSDILSFEEQLSMINELKNIKHYRLTETEVLIFYYQNLSRLFIFHNKYTEALTIAKEAEDWLNNNSRYSQNLNIVQEVNTLINISIIYCTNNKYKKSLECINKILNYKTKVENIRPDIYCFVRIFNLILHFELGNDDTLPYIATSTYRYLYKRNRLYKFETLILGFIRIRLQKPYIQKELIEEFKELKDKMEKILKDPYEINGSHHFDFISWLESKIENRPFTDIVKEKRLKFKV